MDLPGRVTAAAPLISIYEATGCTETGGVA